MGNSVVAHSLIRRKAAGLPVLVLGALICAGCVEHVGPGAREDERVDCSVVEGVQSLEEFNSVACEERGPLVRPPAPSAAEANELRALMSRPDLSTQEASYQFTEGVLGVCISILGGATDREIAEEAPAWFRANGEEPPVEEVEQIARAIRQQGWCESDWLHTP